LTDKKARKGLLKDFCAMANSGGGILLIGIKDRDCRPLPPPKAGLQNITKSGKHIESPDAGTEHRIREARAASQNAVDRSHEEEHRRPKSIPVSSVWFGQGTAILTWRNIPSDKDQRPVGIVDGNSWQPASLMTDF
jgi:Putative DNA-binding domain